MLTGEIMFIDKQQGRNLAVWTTIPSFISAPRKKKQREGHLLLLKLFWMFWFLWDIKFLVGVFSDDQMPFPWRSIQNVSLCYLFSFSFFFFFCKTMFLCFYFYVIFHKKTTMDNYFLTSKQNCVYKIVYKVVTVHV